MRCILLQIIIGLTHENRTTNPTPSISRLCLQEKHRPQGTGTYFPDSVLPFQTLFNFWALLLLVHILLRCILLQITIDLTHENPMNNSTPSNFRLCLEEKHKPRGTGKYFPDTVFSLVIFFLEVSWNFSFISAAVISYLTHEICRMVVHAGRSPHNQGEGIMHQGINVSPGGKYIAMALRRCHYVVKSLDYPTSILVPQ